MNVKHRLPAALQLRRLCLSILLMLTLQAAGAAVSEMGIEKFDLRHVNPSNPAGRSCASRGANEIVVCGSRRDSHRYRPLPGEPEPQPPLAEVRLPGGASAYAHLDGATLPNGMVSKRVMITIKKPF
jgi:hypothetical protein